MIKYRRSIEAIVLFWIMFFVLLGCSIFVTHRWSFIEFLIFFCIFEVPTFILFPLVYRTIKIDNERISLNFGFISLRTFSWSEVYEAGIAYTRGRRAASGMYIEFIYISKRPITNEERLNILNVKDHKNFITMENRGNIIEDIKKYSKLPFRELPTTEDFYNM